MFSRSWNRFSELSTDPAYITIVSALETFDVWSKLASTTDLHFSDEHLKNLCCLDNKRVNHQCCATLKLVKNLEDIGEFGDSLKVHFPAQHVGPFAYRHRMLGAVMEEGLEKMHRTIKDDMERISQSSQLDRLKLALQRWSVQVQLSDMRKCAN
jgi:hypothetical protein